VCYANTTALESEAKTLKLRTRTKIIIGFMSMSLLMLLVGVLTIYSIRYFQRVMLSIIDENVSSLRSSKEMEIALFDQKKLLANYLLDGDSKWLALSAETKDRFLDWLQKAEATSFTEKEKELVLYISEGYKQYISMYDAVVSLYQAGEVKQAQELALGRMDIALRQIIRNNEELSSLNEMLMSKTQENGVLVITKITWVILLIIFSSVLLGLGVGILLSRSITKPIYQLIVQAKTVSGDDLTQAIEISSRDEIEKLGRHFGVMMSKIEATNKQLEESRRELILSERLAALGQLAAGVAHEVRNPLTSITMRLYSLREQSRSESQEDDVKVIMEEIDRIEKIIQQFLSFARPPQPNVELTNIVEILDGVILFLLPRMSKQNVLVSKEYQEDVSPILVDKSQMRQVFLNLILNAIQAMPDGGELKIATDAIETSSGRFLRVQVSDTGAGFEPSIQEHLFEPFFTTRADGTGLGLSVAYRIVESHGGTIRAQSEKGRGATFTVELPYQRGSWIDAC